MSAPCGLRHPSHYERSRSHVSFIQRSGLWHNVKGQWNTISNAVQHDLGVYAKPEIPCMQISTCVWNYIWHIQGSKALKYFHTPKIFFVRKWHIQNSYILQQFCCICICSTFPRTVNTSITAPVNLPFHKESKSNFSIHNSASICHPNDNILLHACNMVPKICNYFRCVFTERERERERGNLHFLLSG